MNSKNLFDTETEYKDYIELENKAKKFKAYLEHKYIQHYILHVDGVPSDDPIVKSSKELLKALRNFIGVMEYTHCW